MRLNAPAMVMASAALVAPNLMPSSSAMADSPQGFEACAAAATTFNDENDVIVEGDLTVNFQVGQQTATADLSVSQVGLIAPSGVECDGELSVRDRLGLQAGSYSSMLPNLAATIVLNNQTQEEYAAPEAKITSSFSYATACRVGRSLSRHSNTVGLSVIESRTYTDNGYAPVQFKKAIRAGSLLCSYPKGPGPQLVAAPQFDTSW